MSVWQRLFLPYIVLTILTLVILLVKPIKEFLGQVKLGFAFPGMVTGYGYEDPAADPFSPLAIFTHAGMFLLQYLPSLVSSISRAKAGFVRTAAR